MINYNLYLTLQSFLISPSSPRSILHFFFHHEQIYIYCHDRNFIRSASWPWTQRYRLELILTLILRVMSLTGMRMMGLLCYMIRMPVFNSAEQSIVIGAILAKMIKTSLSKFFRSKKSRISIFNSLTWSDTRAYRTRISGAHDTLAISHEINISLLCEIVFQKVLNGEKYQSEVCVRRLLLVVSKKMWSSLYI